MSTKRQHQEPRPEAAAPAVILVKPQLGENIGLAARAMLNCGLTDLRLVRPRDGWPNRRAVAAATGASAVVEEASIYPTTGAAVADLERVFAATARHRDMHKEIVTPRQAAVEARSLAARGERCGLLFGPERTGLDNDDVALASKVLHIPLNPAFSSLNLAQAVLLVAYEWNLSAGAGTAEPGTEEEGAQRATSGELLNFFEHLEQELDASGFLRVAERRSIMVRSLRNLFHRADLLQHEVKTLHGVIAALTGRRKDGAPARVPGRKSSGPRGSH